MPKCGEVCFKSDLSGSLNNTYFTLNSENNESLYHVWHNVNGAGSDPAPVNSLGIEVQINTNDEKEIVCLATKLALDNIRDFTIERVLSDKIKITNSRKGLADDTVDNGTGFSFIVKQQGAEKLMKSVDVPFDGNSRYLLNTQEKRFENYPITATEVTLTGEVDVQGAIEEIGASASPGFSFGRSGNVSTNAWLNNEGVPSNKAGRYIFIDNPILFQIFVSNENINTFTISIYEHEGNEINLTLLDTLTITADRDGSKETSVAVTAGRQIAIKLTSGSAKNIIAGLILKGTN